MGQKKLTCLLLLLSLITFGQKAKPSLKTIICKYDSAIIISYPDMSSVYFTAESDKKVYEFIKPDVNTERKAYAKFWNESPIKTDSISGTEYHTKTSNIGLVYEITYTTEKVEMEGGMGNVNIIKDFAEYDSIFILKKEELAKWKIQDKKIDLKNPTPNNPVSVAKKYVAASNSGDYKTTTQLSITELQSATHTEKGDCVPCIIERVEKKTEKALKKITPELLKIELAKVFLSEIPLNIQLKNPVVHYLSDTEAVVAISRNGKKLMYLTMAKFGTSWKVVCIDDIFACKSTAQNRHLKDVFLMRVKELNPE